MSTSSTIVELSTHTHFPIKLTANNFPSWRKQVLSTLTGLELEQFVDGRTEPPPKTLEGKPNPTYRLWFRQDQILLGALLGSCSDTIQPIVSSADTSNELFKRLTESYAGVSRSRIISLRSKLATNSKGTKPVAEYLNEMKAIADELALAQKPIDDDDLIVHILTHLGDDYKEISAALKIRDTPITFSDFYEKLVDHERSLQTSKPVSLIATVNNTQSIPGHDTKFCRKLARFLQNNNINVSTNPTVNASMASSSQFTPPLMFDTGASDHATPDQSYLHHLSEYGGPDEIVLGNGSSHGGATHAGSQH
ncbi:hypothetical protein HanIR_Chr09g0413451 [Helianthus annuus]|nr:hypothetical protein HanIR_Chr09g0413451 [Helianthus annuus]